MIVEKFTQDYLWLSIVTRHPWNQFTRVQRLSCCMTLLLCDMLINVMFWKMGGTTAKRDEQRTYEPCCVLSAVGLSLLTLRVRDRAVLCRHVPIHRPDVRGRHILWVPSLINETVLGTYQELYCYGTLSTHQIKPSVSSSNPGGSKLTPCFPFSRSTSCDLVGAAHQLPDFSHPLPYPSCLWAALPVDSPARNSASASSQPGCLPLRSCW